MNQVLAEINLSDIYTNCIYISKAPFEEHRVRGSLSDEVFGDILLSPQGFVWYRDLIVFSMIGMERNYWVKVATSEVLEIDRTLLEKVESQYEGSDANVIVLPFQVNQKDYIYVFGSDDDLVLSFTLRPGHYKLLFQNRYFTPEEIEASPNNDCEDYEYDYDNCDYIDELCLLTFIPTEEVVEPKFLVYEGSSKSKNFPASLILFEREIYQTTPQGKDLSGNNLVSADLSDGNLRSANLVGANLTNANLRGANLINADLSNANLQNADLSNANLIGAKFDRANLQDASLINTQLWDVSFKSANLRNTKIDIPNKAGSDLNSVWKAVNQGAKSVKLVGADLSDADLKGVDLSNTNLGDARLVGANLSNANLNNICLIDSYAWDTNLSGANLSNAKLKGTNFKNSNLSGVNLEGADLSSANLRDADLSGANLSNAILNGTKFRHNNLNNANLSYVDLNNTSLKYSGSTFQNAYFKNNLGISSTLKNDLIAKGAIFDESED